MDQIYRLFEQPIFINIASIALLVVVVFVVVKILQRAIPRVANDSNGKYRLKKLVSFLGYLLFIFGLMFIFNAKLSGIGTALGVAGAGIAFALQEVIVSFAGYIAIFTGGFFRVGDRVQLGGTD